jgi:hypothetical protein
MGVPFGLVETQLALALNSPMREQMIASLIRILAEQGRGAVGRRVPSGATIP